MDVVLVAGALANKPNNGGGVWERLSWVVGLRRLGFDAYFVEQAGPAADVEWFRASVAAFGLSDRATLLDAKDEPMIGLPLPNSAALLVNLSGHLTRPEAIGRARRTAYVDVDPGFTQLWHTDAAVAFTLPKHDAYFTIGENIGRPSCTLPTCGVEWRPTRQPVVLDDWPAAVPTEPGRFTTVASWRGPFGPVVHSGRTLGLKVHEFRGVIDLPRRTPFDFELALDIHPADAADRESLLANGWRLTDPRTVAGDAAAFRSYVRESPAEFSVAQGVYVGTNCGWFSDRTVRYLASGRPCLVQDTGFGRWLPIGEGIVAFRTPVEAADGARQIVANYTKHAKAARAVAEEFFDSDKVIGRLLEIVL